MECREQGWSDPAFVYDEEKDLFRFRDGRLAFSREHMPTGRFLGRGPDKGAMRTPWLTGSGASGTLAFLVHARERYGVSSRASRKTPNGYDSVWSAS